MPNAMTGNLYGRVLIIFSLHFHSLEAVPHSRDPQLQISENNQICQIECKFYF